VLSEAATVEKQQNLFSTVQGFGDCFGELFGYERLGAS
jgi:hypothetical protein